MYRWHLEFFHQFDRVFTFWDAPSFPQIVHEQTALPWYVGRNFDELEALTLEQCRSQKRDAVSWITSSATHKDGHKVRMTLKDYLIAQRFPFDLFGRGFTPIDDKFDALFPYKYSIAIENHACPHYWTEKIADCFLSWTVPIYSGPQNILDYFPPRSMIAINPRDPELALRTIRDALESDFFDRNADSLAEARELVLRRYQFFPHIDRLVERYGVVPGTPKQRFFIPAHPMHYRGETPLQSVKRLTKRWLHIR